VNGASMKVGLRGCSRRVESMTCKDEESLNKELEYEESREEQQGAGVVVSTATIEHY